MDLHQSGAVAQHPGTCCAALLLGMALLALAGNGAGQCRAENGGTSRRRSSLGGCLLDSGGGGHSAYSTALSVMGSLMPGMWPQVFFQQIDTDGLGDVFIKAGFHTALAIFRLAVAGGCNNRKI